LLLFIRVFLVLESLTDRDIRIPITTPALRWGSVKVLTRLGLVKGGGLVRLTK
jgi:hypothetical protein